LDWDAPLWTHCHQRTSGGSTPEQHLLEQMGVSVQPLTGGCGLAGSWGFEKGKYDISLDCGEQALLPAVRNAEKDTLIVAAGFSCKTQIEQAGTGRGALHIAQVMKIAREEGHRARKDGLPESGYNHVRPKAGLRRTALRTAAPIMLGTGAMIRTCGWPSAT